MNKGRVASDALLLPYAEKLTDALLLALRSGKWPNRFLTIHFGKARLGGNDRLFFEAFLKFVRDWLYQRGAGSICYAAAFEGHGGQHVHMLMHVPLGFWPDYHVAKVCWIEHALKRVTREQHDGIDLDGVLRDRAVFNYRDCVRGLVSEQRYLDEGLRRLLLYMLKGAIGIDTPRFLGLTEDEIDQLKRKFFPSDQGRVWGRRISVSHILLPGKASPPLRVGPRCPWLEEAERAAEAGRDLHRKTLTLGDKSGNRRRPQPGAGNGAHRRSR
jgi:hypothetical protein